jgi:hypothetical protein
MYTEPTIAVATGHNQKDSSILSNCDGRLGVHQELVPLALIWKAFGHLAVVIIMVQDQEGFLSLSKGYVDLACINSSGTVASSEDEIPADLLCKQGMAYTSDKQKISSWQKILYKRYREVGGETAVRCWYQKECYETQNEAKMRLEIYIASLSVSKMVLKLSTLLLL